MIDKNSQFYITAKNLLDDYVAGGGDVNDLGVNDKIYKFIKNTKVKDENGQYINLEEKFSQLGHPRKAKYKESKQALIAEVDAYKRASGSFHIIRKKLPFYPQLYTYASRLQRQGVDITYEQIMKGLGYKDYSDTYFRCMGIFELEKYRDDNGYVDSYRQNEKLKAYIISLGKTLNLPYYLVITLLADEKLEKCYIDTEYIEYVKTQLQQHVKEYGTLKGLKRKNNSLYYRFHTLMKYYGDGSESVFTADEWLNIFDLSGVENRFKKSSSSDEVDVKPIMTKLKQQFGKGVIRCKNLDSKDYRIVVKKAIKLAIPIKELFKDYGLKYEGNMVNRLSTMQVTQIPYLDEMKALRDDLLLSQGITAENGYCKEEIFEARVEACQHAYNKFKDKMFNFEVGETINLEEKIDL